VHFQIIYPGEQEVPLLSVEMGYLRNSNITNAAAPTTMLMSMLDDYVCMPIPASHMISGTVDLQPFMRARNATWSCVPLTTYYGKVESD